MVGISSEGEVMENATMRLLGLSQDEIIILVKESLKDSEIMTSKGHFFNRLNDLVK